MSSATKTAKPAKKEKKEKKTKKGTKDRKKLSSLFFLEEADADKEIPISYEKCSDFAGINFIENKFPQLFTEDQLKILQEEKLFLYYRGIQHIVRVSDPDYDFDDEDLREKDPLANLTGCFYLLPNLEKDRLKYERRRSPVEQDIILRLAYATWDFAGVLNGNTGFFIDHALLDTTKRIKDKSLQEARMKALAFMTHLAVDQDQQLRDKLGDLEIDLQKKETELDQKRDRELLGMLRDGTVDKLLREKFHFEQVNLTSILSLIAGVIVGGVSVYLMMKGG